MTVCQKCKGSGQLIAGTEQNDSFGNKSTFMGQQSHPTIPQSACTACLGKGYYQGSAMS